LVTAVTFVEIPDLDYITPMMSIAIVRYLRLAPRGCALIAALLTASCMHSSIPGPAPPAAESIVEIRVTNLDSAPPRSHSVSERKQIEGVANSYALASYGWSKSGRSELPASYRIDLLDQDGKQVTYWLGPNSALGTFPCYAICSGWWIAPSSDTGELESSRYKGLTSTTYFNLFGNLDLFRNPNN
jgi:hypothetical protein